MFKMSEEGKKESGNITLILKKQEDGLYHTAINGEEYAFRKWTWGEKNRLYAKCSRFGSNGEPIFESGEFTIQMLMTTLKIAPFKITRENIESHPDSPLIDVLIKLTEKINLLGQIEIQNL